MMRAPDWARGCVSFVAVVLRGAAVLLTGLSAVIGCAEAQTTGAAVPIKIGWQPAPVYRMYAAQKLGAFERAGLAPTFIKFAAGPPMLAAFQTKDIDVTFMGSAPFVIGLSQGLAIKAILIEQGDDPVNGLVVQRGRGIETMADLRGKKIGVTVGSTAYLGLRLGLAKAGLKAEDVTVLNMPVINQLPAFLRGDIDGMWAWAPWNLRAEFEGNGRFLVTHRDLGVRSPGIWAARAEWIREKPDAVRRFLHALHLAQEALAKDRSIVRDTLMENLAISEKLANVLIERDLNPTLEEQIGERYPTLVGPDGLGSAIKDIASAFYAEKFIKSPVDVSGAVDAGPLQEYLKTRR